jgi:hypothetical protein
MSLLRRICGILMAAALLLGGAGPAASSTEEAGICEKALYVCLTTPGNNLPWDVVQCVWGYGFCREYILPLLDGR